MCSAYPCRRQRLLTRFPGPPWADIKLTTTAEGSPSNADKPANGPCPHEGTAQEAECPADLPEAPLPERAAHLYACQMLFTRKIAAITGIDRQRITRLLNQAGITVKPRGAGVAG